jgi:hypothetical protein
MEMDKPPLDWAIDTGRVEQGLLKQSFEAEAQECGAVAAYLGVPAVEALKLRVEAAPLAGRRYRVKGRLSAVLCRESVVSLDPVREEIAEDFDIEYRHLTGTGRLTEDDSEDVTVSLEEADIERVENEQLAVGRLACELLSLAMDPYPRGAGESYAAEAGDAGLPNPFTVLERLKPGNTG